MFESNRWNVVVGLITGNLLLGISYGWWVDKHNRHHANPNHIEMDPDIGPGVDSYSEEQALASSGIRRVVAKRQAALFFPLLLGLGWAMHWKGLTFLWRERSRYRRLEVTLIALHVVLFLGSSSPCSDPGGAWRLSSSSSRPPASTWLAVCPQSQGHAAGGRKAGLPAPAGAHLAERAPGPADRRVVRRTQLPDRAPSLPDHVAQPRGACPRDRAAVLRRTRDPLRRDFHPGVISEILAFLHEVGEPLRRDPEVLCPQASQCARWS